MPNPTFPNYVSLTRKGFGRERGAAAVRTPMESGPPKQRKVRSRVLVKRALTYLAESLANYNSFMTWFQDDIDEGAVWFDWTDPLDSQTKSARIVAGTLKDQLVGGALAKWEISFVLETWSA